MKLSTTIKSIQDIMRKDDGVDGDAQRLGQLTWMLFLKVFDQREQDWEADNPLYISPLPEDMRWRSWAAFETNKDGKRAPKIAAGDVIEFVNNELFPVLKNLNVEEGSQQQVIRSIFQDVNNYMKSGVQFLAVVEKLEDAIDFHDFKTRANLGDVYEQLLNDLRGAGNAGEFYTPRAITQFMVDRVNPSLSKRETVMDPACGTGGFLTAAIDHLRHQLGRKPSASARKSVDDLIRGIEKKSLPYLLCTTNLVLHDVEVDGQIERKNTLAIKWDDWSERDRVECIVTNPPFGGYEEDSVAAGYHHPTKETADLFMQLIVQLLKENGRAAVVLPDGFLFGEGIKFQIKEKLMRQCKLHTVVRLPKGVFAPYTTIKSNLLFFTKIGDACSEEFASDDVWYYEHQLPSGYKSYSKTKPIRFEDFEEILQWWGDESDGFSARLPTPLAWKWSFRSDRLAAQAAAAPYWDRARRLADDAAALEKQANTLKESSKRFAHSKRAEAEEGVEALRQDASNLRIRSREAHIAGDRLYWPVYNLDRKNPNALQEDNHDPDVLLEKLAFLVARIQETENDLRSELAAALTHRLPSETD